jgi:Haemolysin-type calcium binding protein related domain
VIEKEPSHDDLDHRLRAYGGQFLSVDLVLSQQGNDLRIALHGSTDRVTIQNWYTGTAAQTEIIQAANGQQLLNTQVAQLIQAMAHHRVLRDAIRILARDLRATTTREGRALSRYCDYVPQLDKIEAAHRARIEAARFGW